MGRLGRKRWRKASPRFVVILDVSELRGRRSFSPLPRDFFGGGGDQLVARDHQATILSGDLPGRELRAELVENWGLRDGARVGAAGAQAARVRGAQKAPESDGTRAQFELGIASEISYVARRVGQKMQGST